MIPLVIVCGKAGSGKDTLGNRLAEKLDGVTLGLADPMKRYMAQVFQFSDTQLYGPSEERNKIDPRYTNKPEVSVELHACWDRLQAIVPTLSRLFGNDVDGKEAVTSLMQWFADCRLQAVDKGGLSPRYALQTFGTEWGRTLDPEVWSRLAINTARKILGGEHLYDRRVGLTRVPTMKRPPNLVVITDGRFGNEIINAKSAGGAAIEVRRPSAADTASTGIAGHASEAGLDEVPAHYYDYRVVNDSSLEQFLAVADYLGRDFVAGSSILHTSQYGRMYGGSVTRHPC